MKQQPTTSNHRLSGKWLIAFLFLASGVLLLARNFGWITVQLFSILVSWYMLLIVMGLFSLLVRHYFSGLVLIAIGAAFLVPHLELSWLPQNAGEIVWPTVLIIAGISFFFAHRGKRGCRGFGNRHTCAGNKQQFYTTDGFVRSDNSFSGVQQVVLDEVFKGAEINNLFGGTLIDLRRTNIEPGETYIDVECKFGGIELYIPSQWNVVIRSNVFLGACEDKRWRDMGSSVNKELTLVIRGTVSFGGVEIKS